MESSLPTAEPSPADLSLRQCDGLLVLALGSNRDHPQRRLVRALDRLGEAVGPLEIAPLYLTAPISAIAQDPFFNTVALARRPVPVDDDAALEARRLLTLAKALETEAGRVAGPRDGPRPLDVDLVFWGELNLSLAANSVATGDAALFPGALELPHPRFRERRFVLAPLADLAPNLCFPDGVSVQDLLTATAGQDAERISWR